jgi:hypothetical protein
VKVVAWFSAGAASAVMCKLLLARRQPGQQVVVARIELPEDEHEDNERFARDVEAWLGVEIVRLRSREYAGCLDVFTRRRYMSGIAGAICTTELKKAVRLEWERKWEPTHQAFGYTAEEADRAAKFRGNNPEVRLLTPLIDAGLGKADCKALLERAGIALPAIYGLGFPNANCIGCVKATAPRYWNRVRRHFPERFAALAALSREIGARLARVGDERVFLDELDATLDEGDEALMPDCSLLCAIAESEIAGMPAPEPAT